MKHVGQFNLIVSLMAAILMLDCPEARAAEYTVTSPDRNHSIGFTLSEGMLYYDVSYQGTTILSDSRLALTLDGDDLSGNFRIDRSRTDSKNGSWVPVVGSKSSYADAYNERVIQLSEKSGSERRLDLCFRAYNEGVAFRYTIPKQAALANLTISSENTEFQFTGDHMVYWDDYPQAKYTKVKMSEMGDHAMRPLLLEAGSHFVAIAEAGSLEHYAPMMLNRNGDMRLKTSFRRGTVSATSPMSTPWRVIMVANNPGTLVENHYLLQNLSPPCALSDTSWIKPGKVWRSRLTTAGAKAIIDYAAANNYQYEGKSFPELEFWKEMPTTWDDSKVIHGSIGHYMTVARRKGKSWFVGTITNDGRSLDIPLSFLGDGTYTAKVYKEDSGDKKRVTIELFDVTCNSTITASMSAGSGHAIWIYPTEPMKR